MPPQALRSPPFYASPELAHSLVAAPRLPWRPGPASKGCCSPRAAEFALLRAKAEVLP